MQMNSKTQLLQTHVTIRRFYKQNRIRKLRKTWSYTTKTNIKHVNNTKTHKKLYFCRKNENDKNMKRQQQ